MHILSIHNPYHYSYKHNCCIVFVTDSILHCLIEYLSLLFLLSLYWPHYVCYDSDFIARVVTINESCEAGSDRGIS